VAPQNRVRTINFFEVVQYVNPSESKRFEHADWQELLKGLRHTELKERVWEGGDKTLIGDILFVDDTYHLKLMSVRDESAWIEVYDPAAYSIAELTLGTDNVLVETSIVGFLDFGNVVGIIQGSTAAPTSTALARWINGLKLFGDGVFLETRAMVAHEAQQKIKSADEVTSVSVKMHTNKADALIARQARVGSVLRTVKEEFGDMTVTVTLTASKARGLAEGRQALRTEMDHVFAATEASEVDRASAKLVYFDADETSRTESVDFIKQRITAKRSVQATDDNGDPIRNASAVHAILDVAQEHATELRRIVEEDAA
jgi:hypothetical protein